PTSSRKSSSAATTFWICTLAVWVRDVPRYLMTCGAMMAASKPRIASTTSSSRRVKPASWRRLRILFVMSGSQCQIVKAQDCRHDGGDDSCDDTSHQYGDCWRHNRNQALDRSANFAIEDIG